MRLSLSSLPSVPQSARPPFDPCDVRVGIAHLGIGAFHRAHQAVLTQAAMAAGGDLQWGICGVTQRSAGVAQQLLPQDGLYTVLTRSADGVRADVVGAVRDVLPGATRRAETVRLLAAPAVRCVTLTVTEKGYRRDPVTGRLRLDDPEIRADIDTSRPPISVVGQLVRGIQQRLRDDAGSLNVISCDNLPHNGALLAGLVREFAGQLHDADLDAFLDSHVRFPATMVDRIVPATTNADRTEAARLLGVVDEGVVNAEPFSQWVIQDDFAADRPCWEKAGAILTADVAPYEALKLRLLNGTHSALAYLGALAGRDHISEVVADENFRRFARELMDCDASPTLRVPDGFDLDAYKDDVIQRFANPALRHRTIQIAMDGSQKLTQRLLGTIRDRRAAGAEPRHAALAVAAWMRFVSLSRSGAFPLDDPLAARLQTAVDDATRPRDVVEALLGVSDVFGADLREDRVLGELLVESLEALAKHGAAAAVTALDSASATSTARGGVHVDDRVQQVHVVDVAR